MSDMRTLLPSTRPGRWSLAFFAVALASLLVMIISTVSGQRGGATLSDNWWISGPAFAAAASSLSGLVAGAVAVLRRRERSVVVLAALAAGVIATLFVLGEVAVPH